MNRSIRTRYRSRWWLVVFAAHLLAIARAAPAFPITVENGALRLTIESVRTAARQGSAEAASGRQFLVLATRWENRIDSKLAAKRGLPTAFLIENLAQHLFLVIDGRFTGVLRSGIDDGAGRKSLGQVSVPRPGAKTIGDVVFEIPAGSFTSADLRFYDDVSGYLKLALAGEAPALKPLLPLQKNEIAELGVFAFENPATAIAAPKGFHAVAIELGVRSVWTTQGDAPAYENTAPGTSVTRVNLLDWPETWKYINVVVDGDYACAPTDASTLPNSARFIPEFFSGGRLVFAVPDDAQSLELVCEMAHAAADSGVLDLPPLVFPLAGKKPAGPLAKPQLTIMDQMFEVAITGAKKTRTFAGESAGPDEQFVVLDVRVTNQGTTGEFFQPAEQLLLAGPDEAEIPLDELTARSPRPPQAQVHLAPGMRRRFHVVFRLAAAIASPRLSFHGGEFMKQFPLEFSP